MRIFLLGLALVLSPLLAGCDASPAGLPMTSMRIGNRNFNLEIAATDGSMERGLMKRDSMPEDHGMIFIFPGDEVRDFWMKNTRFPLDILFADGHGRIVSIHQMDAYDEHHTSSDLPARYAIELNRGAADAAGVKVGDQLPLPPLPAYKDK
jgi:uncharacterized membrane protein (UPF0127 family)